MRGQSSGFNRGFNGSHLTVMSTEVHMFCWNTLAGVLIKIPSIINVVNLDKTTHILE